VFSCELTASVRSLEAFFQHRENVTFHERCSAGELFIEDIETALDLMTFWHYFEQDPALFWRQFFKALEENLFKKLIDKLLNIGVTFVGKEIKALVRKVLDEIDGPEVADKVGAEIAAMVADVILHHRVPDRTDLDQIVLDIFTGILNKEFAKILLSPIATPKAGPPYVYTWEMRFGGTTVHPLPHIMFDLGKHGPAQLALDCTPDLVARWTASVDVVWSREKGISVKFPVSPAMSAGITLESGTCDMKGRILVIAAELKATAELEGHIAVLPEGDNLKALEFHFGSSLVGQAELGLVGILKKKTGENPWDSLPALPHVRTGLRASWEFDYITGHTATTPHMWKYENPQVCLGTLLVKLLKRVAEEVNKVLDPLEPIFGPNGILLRPIPGLEEIFGPECNVLKIAEVMCSLHSDKCDIKTVEKLCKVIYEISKDLEMIKKWEQFLLDPEGCIDIQLLFKSFSVDWTKPHP
jgi:hypothetical protein